MSEVSVGIVADVFEFSDVDIGKDDTLCMPRNAESRINVEWFESVCKVPQKPPWGLYFLRENDVRPR